MRTQPWPAVAYRDKQGHSNTHAMLIYRSLRIAGRTNHPPSCATELRISYSGHSKQGSGHCGLEEPNRHRRICRRPDLRGGWFCKLVVSVMESAIDNDNMGLNLSIYGSCAKSLLQGLCRNVSSML